MIVTCLSVGRSVCYCNSWREASMNTCMGTSDHFTQQASGQCRNVSHSNDVVKTIDKLRVLVTIYWEPLCPFLFSNSWCLRKIAYHMTYYICLLFPLSLSLSLSPSVSLPLSLSVCLSPFPFPSVSPCFPFRLSLHLPANCFVPPSVSPGLFLSRASSYISVSSSLCLLASPTFTFPSLQFPSSSSIFVFPSPHLLFYLHLPISLPLWLFSLHFSMFLYVIQTVYVCGSVSCHRDSTIMCSYHHGRYQRSVLEDSKKLYPGEKHHIIKISSKRHSDDSPEDDYSELSGDDKSSLLSHLSKTTGYIQPDGNTS